jgi:hypothetical protein
MLLSGPNSNQIFYLYVEVKSKVVGVDQEKLGLKHILG